MERKISIEEFRKAIQRLPEDKYFEDPRIRYHTQKEYWLGWLGKYHTAGPYGRKTGVERDAKFAYNHIAEPKMLLYLFQAIPLREELVQAAEKACETGGKTVMAKCGAIRKVVPWAEIYNALFIDEELEECDVNIKDSIIGFSSTEYCTNFVSFYLEISKSLPDDNSQKFRPLGISCAALQFDGEAPRLWATPLSNGQFAEKMSRDDLQRLVKYLIRAVDNGWQIVTWNGLGFYFDVLAEESGLWEECRYLALHHIDMMFHFFCVKGFPLGLNNVTLGMGLSGKSEGTSSDLAPVLWQQGEYQAVLDHVAQDVVTTLEVAKTVLVKKQIEWISNSGQTQEVVFPEGWLTVIESAKLPYPDTSWMAEPMKREKFWDWTLEKPVEKSKAAVSDLKRSAKIGLLNILRQVIENIVQVVTPKNRKRRASITKVKEEGLSKSTVSPTATVSQNKAIAMVIPISDTAIEPVVEKIVSDLSNGHLPFDVQQKVSEEIIIKQWSEGTKSPDLEEQLHPGHALDDDFLVQNETTANPDELIDIVEDNSESFGDLTPSPSELSVISEAAEPVQEEYPVLSEAASDFEKIKSLELEGQLRSDSALEADSLVQNETSTKPDALLDIVEDENESIGDVTPYPSESSVINDAEELAKEVHPVSSEAFASDIEAELQLDSNLNEPVQVETEIETKLDLPVQAEIETISEPLTASDFPENGAEDLETIADEEEYEFEESSVFLDEADQFGDMEGEENEDQWDDSDLEDADEYDLDNKDGQTNVGTDHQLPGDELIKLVGSPESKLPKKVKRDLKHTRPSYYARFTDQRHIAPNVREEEINDFLNQLKADNLDEICSWPLHKLENFLFHAIQRYEFVGELPISNQSFTRLAEYIRYNARKKGKPDQTSIPPVLFLVSMVFCARYSETDARKFWEPYAHLVWGLDEASLSFQQKCRHHFVNCRKDLHDVLSFNFNYQSEGDVVRPIYQHAIIPSYLQDHFADWLVNHFQFLLQFPAEKLPFILKGEKSLNYVPGRLSGFIRSGETEEAAAHLIIQMANAVNLFHETEQVEAVESVISSSIERSLWRAIYQKLIVEQSQLMQIRKIAPRLEWVWNLHDDDVYLNISNVRSDQSEKPDSMIWAEKDATYLKGEEIFLKVYPWKLNSGDWELDSMDLPGDGPAEGSILVLSEEFDLDKSKDAQSGHIVFEKEVPLLQDSIMFFRINSRTNKARKRSQLDAEGEWILVAKQPIQLTNNSGGPISQRLLNIPYRLRESGYNVAARCDIQFPVTIQTTEDTILIERPFENIQLIPYLDGNSKITGLSAGIPPVFLSSEILLQFSIDFGLHPLHRTWLSIQRGGEFVQSILLADIKKQSHLNLEENRCTIHFGELLPKPGAYSINLLHNLKTLLDEPVQFAWLPEEVKIFGPDPNACYSPINPLEVVIQGVSAEQIISYQEEKNKVREEDGEVKVEWKVLKDPLCRFAINWDDTLIRFAWDIQRVSAWVEGGGDKNQVLEGQESEVGIQVRGYPHETYSWIIEDTSLQRRTQLNARGELCSSLFEIELRDMLQECMQARSTVLIDIHGYTWKLFTYLRKIAIKITSVCYQNNELKITLTQAQKLRGSYCVQVRSIERPTQVENLADLETLNDQLIFPVELVPGTYRVEILLHDEPVQFSLDFQVAGEQEIVEEEALPIEIAEDHGSPAHLFRLLTAGKQDFLLRSYDHLPITAAIEQLQIIHSEEEWVTDEKLEESLKRLLPSWAVLMYPLRFTTKDHRKVLHVFPEQVAYGGRAGKGYVELKIEQERMRICAFWRPVPDTEYSELWMSVPQKPEIKRYCECDQLDTWPVYQCVDCGTIVASRDGSYLKLPPSIVQMHRHGEDRKPGEQFIDTVYKSHIPVSIAQYTERNLSHQAYWAKDVVYQGYLQLLMDGKAHPNASDLDQPINLYSTADYGCAINELYKNLQDSTRLPFIEMLLEQSDSLNLLDYYFTEGNSRVPAFNAMGRLAQYLSESDQVQNIPANILALSMTLRLKNNLPKEYKDLLAYAGLAESELQQVVYAAAQACPKLLEWTIAWAELFYVHAIS
jgi:hypothetical protein